MTTSFDKRLAELDAYLQMLLEKNESLDKRIELAEGHAEKDGLELIKSNLESLLGSIKHAIVLLQIAKVSITSAKTPERPPIKEKASILKQSIKSNIDGKQIIRSNNAIGEAIQTASFSNTSSSTGGRGSNDLNGSNYSTGSNSNNNIDDNIKAHEYAGEATRKVEHVDIASDGDDEDLFYDADEGHQQNNRSNTLSNSTSSRNNSFIEHKNQQNQEFVINSKAKLSNRMSSTSSHNDSIDMQKQSFDDEVDQPSTKNHETHNENAKVRRESETRASVQTATANGHTNSHRNSPNNLIQCDSVDSNVTNTSIDLDISATSTATASIDWDALYDEEEDDLGSLEAEGSVIKHLLSQIRIGMDLTKVVLPTFILERRSLLEMYADFFAHPDLFSSIPDQPNAEARFVQLVRWYLSAFHAGRKSSVAKKPYNPILGEIFICHWDLDKTVSSVDSLATANKDDDVVEQYSKKLADDSLMFVSEQVSHHPPVSAFYTENRAKKISCCAHIYTKSKFLGLSVGVHHIGQGVISLHDHGETYTCTFPSAFGRNILGVPWVELGGPVQIACEQTGYKANVEFLTKPFYGGKKNRITAELFKPDGSSLMSIDGEWNGCMMAKDAKTGEKKMFVDTTDLPVISKHVRPIASQEEFESRNVWKEVTRALKKRDVSRATEAKSRVEQRQRDLLLDRTERQISWDTRYFKPAADDSWTFCKSLKFS